MLKQIFWQVTGIFFAVLFFFDVVSASDQRKYVVSGLKPDSPSGTEYTSSELEAFGVETINSSYFDRAMSYSGTQLRVISLASLAEQLHPGGQADALLLNCFDDYQGIVSMADIRRYDLKLATAIKLQPEFKPPGWLNPLLVVVPDGSPAPYHERFMTANIRELRFVRLEDYYAPLKSIPQSAPERLAGYRAFADNCIFCHSLNGIGGNKGLKLLSAYNFSRQPDIDRFVGDFTSFHGKDNPDKQNIAQFVTVDVLKEIVRFLQDPRLMPSVR
jgi:hypothetical protein